MWRSATVAALLLAPFELVACGGGENEESSCSYARRGPTVLPLVEVSLEEAEELVGFEIVLPAELPEGVTAGRPQALRSTFCPATPPKGFFAVQLPFTGPDYAFLLIEQAGGEQRTDGVPIRINGVEGRIDRHMGEAPAVVSVYWTDGERRYGGTAQLTGGLTEEVFLAILESIPE